MGAVYKAIDREFDRPVALKTIRSELGSDQSILSRFKQEILLARQITHRNIVRVYDLVATEGLKFITMEFVEGRDLKTIIRERRLTVEESIDILMQVCQGLEAAHAEKVVHRDLKPQNIMIDGNGRVAVMDFGLAHHTEDKGLTRTGMLVGTPDYMSPEQALGIKVDHRSDIFALGLIFYELLSGELPFQSESMIGTLVARTRDRAKRIGELRPDLHESLDAMVNRALDPDPNARYQSVTELLEDLRAFRKGASLPSLTSMPGLPALQPTAAIQNPLLSSQSIPAGIPAPAAPAKSRRGLLYAAVGAVAVAVLSVGSYQYFQNKQPALTLTGDKPIKVLVADFRNNTGESVFDGSLEPLFGVALEGASFVTVANRDQARRQAKELRPEAKGLDEQLARLVAVREGYDVIVSGTVDRKGPGYVLTARATDSVSGNLIGAFEESAPGKNALLASVNKLAEPVRRALGDADAGSGQQIAAETFTAASLQAAHLYARAQEQQVSGNSEQALSLYKEALTADPEFGRAYAGLAVINRNLGRRDEAEKYFQLAMSKVDRMSERERLRTQGAFAIFSGDMDKAIESLGELVNRYPADTAGHVNLSLAYVNKRNIPKAIEEAQQAADIYPKVAVYRNNLASLHVFAGNFTQAQRESEEALKINPSYVKAHVTRAVALAGAGQTEAAKEGYERLKSVSKMGASLASMGLADIELAHGRTREGIALLEQGIKSDAAEGLKTTSAAKSVLLASGYLTLGDKAKALASLDKAGADSTDDNLLALTGHLYVAAGAPEKAEGILKQLSAKTDSLAEARAAMLRGEIATARKNTEEALKEINGSIGIADTWLARLVRARAYAASGDLAKAVSDWEACIARQGEGSLLLLDDMPSYSLVPPIYFEMGKAQLELKRSAANATLEKFLALRATSNDAQSTEARKLLGR